MYLKICKRKLGVKLSTKNNFIYGEAGRVSYINTRYLNIIKYWLLICNSSNTKYIKSVYNTLKLNNERHRNNINWVSQEQTLLSTLGFYDAWLSQGVGDNNLFFINF